MSMGLVTGAALAVNKHGALAGWETRSSRSITFSAGPAEVPYPAPNPEGATYTGTAWAGGGSYTQTALAWRRTAGLPEPTALPGTLAYSAWTSDAGNDAGWAASSNRDGPGGTAFLPQFLGDTGLMAGLAVTVSTSPASAYYNWGYADDESYVTGNSYAEVIAQPTLTARPAVWIGTESVSRPISFSGFVAGSATLSGVTHGEGGAEARVFGTALAAGAGSIVAWSARAGTGWKAEPLTADGGDGRLVPLNPSGAFDLNDHGDMVFGDRAVIDGKLVFLNALVPEGVRILTALHINALGSILAYVAIETENANGTTTTTYTPALLHRSDATTVTFSGAHYHELRSDDGTTTYSAPQFKRGTTADRNWPVAYTRSTSVAVGAQLKVPALQGQTVEVRAKFGTDVAFTLSGSSSITVGSGGEFNVPVTTASFALPNAVTLYKAQEAPGKERRRFTINWEFRPAGAAGWSRLDSTQHTLYVTWADPKGADNAPLPAGTAIYETLVNLGVRNADGFGVGKTEQQVVDKIYGEFTDREVRRVVPGTANLESGADAVMKYWGNPSSFGSAGGVSTEWLLRNRDGKCGAWERFFVDVLRSQGIDATMKNYFAPNLSRAKINFGFFPSPDEEETAYRTAFNARLVANGQATQIIYSYPVPVLFIKSWSIGTDKFAPVQIPNQNPAQGNPSPQAFFTDHLLVEYGGRLYDPSYGSGPSANQQAWETVALEAFGYWLHTTESPQIADPNVKFWIWKTAPHGTVLDQDVTY